MTSYVSAYLHWLTQLSVLNFGNLIMRIHYGSLTVLREPYKYVTLSPPGEGSSSFVYPKSLKEKYD